MINSVEDGKKTSANSFAQVAFNLFGFLPAPTFYGLISTLIDDEDSKVPMGCLVYS